MTFFFSFIEYILTFTPDKEKEIMEEQNNCLTKSDTRNYRRIVNIEEHPSDYIK